MIENVTIADQRDGESELVALTRQMCTRIGADLGWDANPVLAVLLQFTSAPAIMTVPLSGHYWGMAEPWRVIRGVADIDALDLRCHAQRWRGFSLFSNAYSFACDCSEDDCEHNRWIAAGKNIGDHPDGQEFRQAFTFTVDGEVAVAGQIRGEHVKTNSCRRGDELAPGGTMPDALWHLVDTTQRRLAVPGN